MTTFAIALGSNLGDRLANLQHARERLGAQRSAPVYATTPVDCPPGSPDFYNTVVELDTDLAPLDLLAVAQSIEAGLGREPEATRAHHAPRPVDIDLLHAGDTVLDHPDLTLPHPRLHLRRFALQPLADLSPDLVLPGQTAPVGTLLTSLQSNEPPLTLVTRTW